MGLAGLQSCGVRIVRTWDFAGLQPCRRREVTLTTDLGWQIHDVVPKIILILLPRLWVGFSVGLGRLLLSSANHKGWSWASLRLCFDPKIILILLLQQWVGFCVGLGRLLLSSATTKACHGPLYDSAREKIEEKSNAFIGIDHKTHSFRCLLITITPFDVDEPFFIFL
jgi:hypothetical protein